MNPDTFHHLDKVRKAALAFPGATEGTCHGTPGFYTGKKLFARLREEGDVLVVYTFERETWMEKDERIFYITDHYKNYPYMLVALDKVCTADLVTLLTAAWRSRATKRLLKEWEEERRDGK